MRFSPGDWKWGVVITLDRVVPVLWAALIMAAAVGGCILLAGCSSVPAATQEASETATVTPDAGGGDATAERSGSEGRAEAGRDLKQDIRDMSEQVTDLSKNIEQHTTTIQETIQSQKSGRSELSGRVAEAVEKIGTLQQRVETLTDNSQQVRGLRNDLGQLSEEIGTIESMVQKTESTVQNYGISQKRLQLEEKQNDRMWMFGRFAVGVMLGGLLISIGAPGVNGWKAQMIFYGLGGLLIVAATVSYFAL